MKTTGEKGSLGSKPEQKENVKELKEKEQNDPLLIKMAQEILLKLEVMQLDIEQLKLASIQSNGSRDTTEVQTEPEDTLVSTESATDPSTETETETDAGPNTETDTELDTETGTDTETGAEFGTEASTESGTEFGETGTESEIETETGGIDTELGTETGADSGTDSGTDSGADSGADTETETETDPLQYIEETPFGRTLVQPEVDTTGWVIRDEADLNKLESLLHTKLAPLAHVSLGEEGKDVLKIRHSAKTEASLEKYRRAKYGGITTDDEPEETYTTQPKTQKLVPTKPEVKSETKAEETEKQLTNSDRHSIRLELEFIIAFPEITLVDLLKDDPTFSKAACLMIPSAKKDIFECERWIDGLNKKYKLDELDWRSLEDSEVDLEDVFIEMLGCIDKREMGKDDRGISLALDRMGFMTDGIYW